MNDLEIVQAFSPLYDDVKEADQFYVKKPLLAHYTSLSTLEKILETDEIWFSNPLFMNDLEEVRFGVLRGVDLVRGSREISDACRFASRAQLFTQYFNHYFQTFESEHAFDTYVFCLSEHDREDRDGMLSMWRGYGSNGNGAAIVFDAGQFKPVDRAPLIIARVHYGSGEERIAWLEGTLTKCARILRDTEIPDDKLYLAAHALFERIKVFALFSKHRGFAEEREWRIVYVRDWDQDNKLAPMFHYWIGPRGVEPKLRLKVAPIEGLTADDLSLAKIVERIVLGPSLSSPLARTAVLRMLDRLGKPYLKEKVYASTIPIRPT
jgi:Protein of unknown function (DUF2971)